MSDSLVKVSELDRYAFKLAIIGWHTKKVVYKSWQLLSLQLFKLFKLCHGDNHSCRYSTAGNQLGLPVLGCVYDGAEFVFGILN